jgi:predicted transcriptional regulator
MVGTIFRKHIEKYEAGSTGNASMYQTWKVVTDLGDDLYSCVRVDNTQDPMGAANPQKRTFKKKDILNHLKNK